MIVVANFLSQCIASQTLSTQSTYLQFEQTQDICNRSLLAGADFLGIAWAPTQSSDTQWDTQYLGDILVAQQKYSGNKVTLPMQATVLMVSIVKRALWVLNDQTAVHNCFGFRILFFWVASQTAWRKLKAESLWMQDTVLQMHSWPNLFREA